MGTVIQYWADSQNSEQQQGYDQRKFDEARRMLEQKFLEQQAQSKDDKDELKGTKTPKQEDVDLLVSDYIWICSPAWN